MELFVDQMKLMFDQMELMFDYIELVLINVSLFLLTLIHTRNGGWRFAPPPQRALGVALCIWIQFNQKALVQFSRT